MENADIVAATTIVLVLIIVYATVAAIIRFLRNVVGIHSDQGPTGQCLTDLNAAQIAYMATVNPATGVPYSACEAAAAAVADPLPASCPKPTRGTAAAHPPYSVFVSDECSPSD